MRAGSVRDPFFSNGHGFDVWLDEEQVEPGDGVFRTIAKGLARSRFLLVCLSDAQLRSGWVRFEYEAVLHREISRGEKRVVPVVIGRLDETKVPLELDWRHRVDFQSGTGIPALLKMLGDARGAVPVPGPASEVKLRLRVVEEVKLQATWLGNETDPVKSHNPLESGDERDHRWYLEKGPVRD